MVSRVFNSWWAVPTLRNYRYQLFDLAKDVGETIDVAAKNPDELNRMHGLLETAIKSAGR